MREPGDERAFKLFIHLFDSILSQWFLLFNFHFLKIHSCAPSPKDNEKIETSLGIYGWKKKKKKQEANLASIRLEENTKCFFNYEIKNTEPFSPSD